MAIDIIKATHRKTGAVFFAPYYEHDSRSAGCRGIAFARILCLAAYDIVNNCPTKTKTYIQDHGLKADPVDWVITVVETGLNKETFKRKLLEHKLLEMVAGRVVLEYSFKGA